MTNQVDTETGLSPGEAARRLAADGPNALPGKLRLHSIFQTSRTPNSMLWIVTAGALGLLVLYAPFLTEMFHFAPLPIAQTMLACAAGRASVTGLRASS